MGLAGCQKNQIVCMKILHSACSPWLSVKLQRQEYTERCTPDNI